MLNKQPENINEQQYDEIDKALEEATRSLPRQKVTEADMAKMIKNGEWWELNNVYKKRSKHWYYHV